jgi:alkanesulfonate monooxygenase SsuD/methylene tetrahydromethanopterin reductase-like flavin-dependent oxidoreductase (luciferase family)
MLRSVKQAIDVAPFDELADPRVLADLAAESEDKGWDGFFVWDHVAYRAPVRAVADPWVALAAIACATSRVQLGPMVTPIPRRRVHKLARETATLDLLSDGRLIFGVGIGSARNGEFEPFGEISEPRERARLLDEGLAQLTRYWAGEFEPTPVQAAIPVWVAAEWPNPRPIRRAARWHGVFPTGVPGPAELAELIAALEADGPIADSYDVVVPLTPGADPAPWARAGATWAVTDFGMSPSLAEVREVIQAGPQALP